MQRNVIEVKSSMYFVRLMIWSMLNSISSEKVNTSVLEHFNRICSIRRPVLVYWKSCTGGCISHLAPCFSATFGHSPGSSACFLDQAGVAVYVLFRYAINSYISVNLCLDEAGGAFQVYLCFPFCTIPVEQEQILWLVYVAMNPYSSTCYFSLNVTVDVRYVLVHKGASSKVHFHFFIITQSFSCWLGTIQQTQLTRSSDLQLVIVSLPSFRICQPKARYVYW